VVDPFKSKSDFKVNFDTAVRKNDMQIVIRGTIAFLFFFFLLFIYAFIVKENKIAIDEILGIDPFLEDCSSGARSLLLIPGLFLSGVIPIIYLFKQVKRLRQNPALHCPQCQTSLVKWKYQNQVCQTGVCPACLEKLFEGKLASEEAAIEYHQKTKTESNHIVRFSFCVSLVGLLIGLPILLWGRNLSVLLGKNTLSILETITLVPVIFLVIPISLWVISKSSVSESQQHINLFREYSNQSDTINQKHTHREQEE